MFSNQRYGQTVTEESRPQNHSGITEIRAISYFEFVGALMCVTNMTWPDFAQAAHTPAKLGDNSSLTFIDI